MENNKGGNEMTNEKYVIGEVYWFKNERAGRNIQSCGILESFENGKARMFNKRFGYIRVTIENLNEHN